MVWVAFALMTVAAVLLLIWPLAGSGGARRGPSADVAFYASQLAEIDGDIARGHISPADAEATRAEIGRRLLASSHQADQAPRGGFRTRRVTAMVAAVGLVPIVTLGLYLQVGKPGQPDEPLATRDTSQTLDFASAIPKIEAHLAADPNDGKGFELIAPIYLRMGRYDDAAKAYSAAIRVLGESPERRAALGQALVMAADGVVTEDARGDFDKALATDPKLPQARFFLALAAEQDGDKDKARDLWQTLAADTPADAPWLGAVRQHLAALTGQPVDGAVTAEDQSGAPGAAGPAGPTGPQAASIAALPPEQRSAAIRGMVDGLAARLAQNGRDPEGWLRLIKAYTVLGDEQRAREAWTDARKGLDGDASALARVDDLARQLGLGG